MKRILTTALFVTALTLRAAEPNIAVSTADKESGINRIVDGKVVEFKTEGGIATASSNLIDVDKQGVHTLTLETTASSMTKEIILSFKASNKADGILVTGASCKEAKVIPTYTKDKGLVCIIEKDGKTEKVTFSDMQFRDMLAKHEHGKKLKEGYVIMIAQGDIHKKPNQQASATGAHTGSGSGS